MCFYVILLYFDVFYMIMHNTTYNLYFYRNDVCVSFYTEEEGKSKRGGGLGLGWGLRGGLTDH